MARVFITGSSDGLGLLAARVLIEQGHEVVVHGRNEGRSREALAAAPGARGVVSGDLSTIAGTRRVADEVNKLGLVDAVIHNAGIGYRSQLQPVSLGRTTDSRAGRAISRDELLDDVRVWHGSDAADSAELFCSLLIHQTSTCSAMARARSTSMPR